LSSASQRGPKALRDQGIQGSVFGEMLLLGEFGEPEVEDCIWLMRVCSHIH
jgi:hypothetical protein